MYNKIPDKNVHQLKQSLLASNRNMNVSNMTR